jgi:hypothetical protein
VRILGALAVAVLLATACAGAPAPENAKGNGTPPPSTLPSPVSAKGGSPPPTPGVPAPNARCVATPAGGPMALVGQAVYDVTDPIHPRLLCQVTNTVTHLFTGDTFEYIRSTGDTGTEVVLHSMGSGNESVVAGWPLNMLNTPFGEVNAWTRDGNEAATAKAATDGAGNQTIEIWLFAQPGVTLLHVFNQPLTDCICRFGLAAPVLSFSPDGQYIVSGWPIGKGATPLYVFRVADHTLAKILDVDDVTAFWDRTGHRLYGTRRTGTSWSWTPEDGLAPLAGATFWPYQVGLSPDGSQVAYTAYEDPANFAGLRVYVYDLTSHVTRRLVDQMRSEVIFVKNRWVWYLEEARCDSPGASTCPPWGTQPTGKVFAMDLTTGVETPVVFASGESPTALQSGWSPAEFWPNS